MTKLRALLAVLALSFALPSLADEVIATSASSAGSVAFDTTVTIGNRSTVAIVFDNSANTAAAAVTLTLQDGAGNTLLVLTPTAPTLSARTAVVIGDVDGAAVAPVLNVYPLVTPAKIRVQWAASGDAVGVRRFYVLGSARHN